MRVRQAALWTLDGVEPAGAALDGARALWIRGRLSAPDVEAHLRALVDLHPVLRTTYQVRGADLVARVGRHGDIDFAALEPTASGEEDVMPLVAREARLPFDLVRGPLLRSRLLRLGDEAHVLLVAVHPIASDQRSLALLLQQLLHLVAGRPVPSLGEAGDAWTEEALARREAALASRSEETDGIAAALDLAQRRGGPPCLVSSGARTAVELDAARSRRLRTLAAEMGVSPDAVLLSTLGAVLRRVTGRADFSLTLAVSSAEVEGRAVPIGSHVTLRPVGQRVAAGAAMHGLAVRAHAAIRDALERRAEPAEGPLAPLGQRPGASAGGLHAAFTTDSLLLPGLGSPFLVDVALGEAGPAHAVGSLLARPLELPRAADSRALLVTGRLDLEAVRIAATWDPRALEEPAVRHLLELYRQCLDVVLDRPETPVSELRIAMPRQGRIGGPAAEDGEESIPDRFLVTARAFPNQVALETTSTSLTYGVLEDRARRIAAGLRHRCAGGGGRVVLALAEAHDMLPAMLGTLMAGKTCVPLDLAAPDIRVGLLMEDAEPDAIVVDRDHEERLAAIGPAGVPRLVVDELAASPPLDPATIAVAPHAAATLLYTSGSTGRPKGVLQNHRNILFHVRNLNRALDVTASDRHSLVASFAFDASTTDLYCSLLSGATLVHCDLRRDGIAHLADRLRRGRVTILHATPTVFRHLMRSLPPAAMLPHLRVVLLGGEPVTAHDVSLFRAHCAAGCIFVNGYGATETSGMLTLERIGHGDPPGTGTVPIGRPLPGIEIVLRDQDGLAALLEGELFVRCDHAALGYWRDPEATARAFLEEWHGAPARLYRTGDIARRHWDGRIRLLGRADRQVKVRGHRVEPGEVEANLASLDGVAEAAVVVRGDAGPVPPELVAYIVPDREPSSAVDRDDDQFVARVRERLAAALPSSMLPSAFVVMATLPLTLTGKVDVLALPAPAAPRRRPADVRARLGGRERVVAEAWTRVLGTGAFGLDDSFFDVGGDSLAMARVHEELETRLHVEVPLYRLFEHPTVRSLARFLDGGPRAEQVDGRTRAAVLRRMARRREEREER